MLGFMYASFSARLCVWGCLNLVISWMGFVVAIVSFSRPLASKFNIINLYLGWAWVPESFSQCCCSVLSFQPFLCTYTTERVVSLHALAYPQGLDCYCLLLVCWVLSCPNLSLLVFPSLRGKVAKWSCLSFPSQPNCLISLVSLVWNFA